jgi:K+-sensing histidine kinase KdpD
MELAAIRNETWKGTAVGIGACVLTLSAGARLQAVTGDVGVLLGLFVATAVAAWYAGRWVGIVTTVVGSFAAAYMLPPAYSFAIAKPADFGALYTFAIGGVIVSLLCGAAWQLRLEARAMETTQSELTRLRARNAELLDKLHLQDAALTASDRFFAEAAHSAGSEATRPSSSTKQQGIRRMLEILVCRATHDSALRSVHLNADRLPNSWLFTAAFRPDRETPAAVPLSPLEVRACNRIVARQGGRCWTSRSGSGAWELKFTLPRA